MRALVFGFAVTLALTLGNTALALENSVAFSILSGPLTAELTLENDYVVLTIDDLTGTSQGWWVNLECDCGFVMVGDIETVDGQLADPNGGPYLVGRTVKANPLFGVGSYRILFQSEPGLWNLSFGSGTGPSI